MSVRNVLDEIQRAVDKGEGKPNDLIEKAKRLIDKDGGDALAVIMTLLGENFDMREKTRELKAKLPTEGAVVLSAEEAKTWEALKAHKPDELTKKLEERDVFEKELKTTKRTQTLTEAATLAGMKPNVLARLAGDSLLIEITGEGDKKAVVVKDDKGVSTPIGDYAKTHWAEFAPALQADSKAQGVNWVNQGGGGSGTPAPSDVVTKRLEANKSRHQSGNALRPAPTPTNGG
jgi:hypothetical protein